MTKEFVGFPKMSRLSRNIIITEKLDGTNGQIYISDTMEPFKLNSGREVPFMVGSRNRWIFPEADNYGFASWAYSHAEELLKLGPGRHFGEWWGQGIQRGYGLKEKRFSLFNVSTWKVENVPACCTVVPTLAIRTFDQSAIDGAMQILKQEGSVAAPGFMDPEGIVIYYTAAGIYMKKTFKNDEQGKGQ